ncbi:MAG: VOC family protein [Firmicutes bacterium]|nr:VOC family protein [Bacillota bacterium]
MKLLHVTIQTNQFQEEVEFYEKVVGLKVEQDMRPMGRNMVFLANSPGETCIEIIENSQAADAGNENLSIGFQTEDAEKKRQELLAAGYEATEMIYPAPKVGFFFVKDPAGVSVQFM